MSNSEQISPTAYATGHLWVRLGLSHPALSTARGRRLDRLFQLFLTALRPLGGTPFDDLMRARHQGIDGLLTRAIDEGRIGQVIEIAAGLSGRGLRLAERYGDRLLYVETDLPAMAQTKQRLLEKADLLSPQHRVIVLDALADEGPNSLAAVAAQLDPKVGTAIITEGLMNYLDPPLARELWARIAQVLQRFPQGLYLSDAYLRGENDSLAATLFRKVLARFVRGGMHVHFQSSAHGLRLMRDAGFTKASIHATSALPETRAIGLRPGGRRVRILEAHTTAAPARRARRKK